MGRESVTSIIPPPPHASQRLYVPNRILRRIPPFSQKNHNISLKGQFYRLCFHTGFLTTGDLEMHWRSFIGARPQSKAPSNQQAVVAQNSGKKQNKDGNKKKKLPFVDICPKWNVGKCAKPAGSCFTNGGVALRHACNWRDFTIPNAQPCAQAHTRRGNH
jgi:hypothetical protein